MIAQLIFRAIGETSLHLSGNTALGTHLNVAARNAICTSKTTQNKLIECIVNISIRDKIIHDINAAKWFTILCDEVVDVAGKELLCDL